MNERESGGGSIGLSMNFRATRFRWAVDQHQPISVVIQILGGLSLL